MRTRLLLLAAIAFGLSCTVSETGSLSLFWGADDPFTEADAAAPTSIAISAISVQSADGGSSDDAATVLAQAPYVAGGTFGIPGQNGYDVDILQATLYDSADAAVIFGRTLPVELAGIQGTTLDIFVQRTGQFARLPQPFTTAPVSPLLAAIRGQYILVADGSGKSNANQAVIYDMNVLAPLENATTLPCSPLSMAPLGGTLLLLLCAPNTAPSGSACEGTDVVACAFDLSGVVTTMAEKASVPAGCGWSDIAGGATVAAPDGDSFIVGATRPAGAKATNCLLKVGLFETTADGGTLPAPLTIASFGTPRSGAAAAWSATYGLVIAGGNQSSNDPPVETLSLGATDAGAGTFVGNPVHGYSVGDLAVGSGAAVLDSDNVLVLAGGSLPDKSVAGVRLFALGGCANCEGEAGSGAGAADAGATDDADDGAGDDGGQDGETDAGPVFPLPLGTAQGFTVGASTALFVGASGSGTAGKTAAFLVSTSGTRTTNVTAVPLQVTTRKGAKALRSPLTSIVVVGGDVTMESFYP